MNAFNSRTYQILIWSEEEGGKGRGTVRAIILITEFTCSHNSPWQSSAWVCIVFSWLFIVHAAAYIFEDGRLSLSYISSISNLPLALLIYIPPTHLPPAQPHGRGLLNVCASMLNKFAYFSWSLVWQKLNFLCKNSTLMTKSERITMRKKDQGK